MPKIPPTITLSQEVKSTDPDPVKLVPLVVGKDKKLIMEKLPDYLAYCATSASNRKGWDMYGVEELLRQKAITEEKLVEYLLSKTGSKNPVDAFVVEYLQAGLYAMYRRDGKKYDVILRSSQAVRNWINAAPNKQRRKIFTPIPDTKTSGRPLKAFQNSMVTKDNKFDWELLPSYVISNEKSRMLSLHDRWGVMKLFELNAKGFSEVKLIEYFLKDLKSDDLFRRSIAERLEDGLLEIYERYGKNEKAIKNATKAVKRWWYNAPPLPK
ncbi:uncharacterized protein PHALS_01877 [Plasmopara halstedii]|uniref:Uncharacterized protein n=1 Tax=Plasmopara halstedii TaxID=4781 RepID=A0A0P1AV81_PLAHL|nr:uncharacterized protein PHALS_01877 [Plasmopara halstedii]CEG45591.1 hypothetical protein PHALS_01877 [Plasmopara halstedii]|eukprot:XP_024581960.1 hypothetical protein PHALS_01877 [Plasmopara halstedii]